MIDVIVVFGMTYLAVRLVIAWLRYLDDLYEEDE